VLLTARKAIKSTYSKYTLWLLRKRKTHQPKNMKLDGVNDFLLHHKLLIFPITLYRHIFRGPHSTPCRSSKRNFSFFLRAVAVVVKFVFEVSLIRSIVFEVMAETKPANNWEIKSIILSVIMINLFYVFNFRSFISVPE
jgi:hypothetical protein